MHIVEVKPIMSAFGRTISDEDFAARIGDYPLRFELNATGWWITMGFGSMLVLCSGPTGSLPFGRETFRRLTGRDPLAEKRS